MGQSFLYILLYLFFSQTFFVYAEGILKVEAKLYTEGQEIPILFEDINCASEFKLMPTTDSHTIEVFNPELNKWTSFKSGWVDQPKLAQKMQIRLKGFTTGAVPIAFQFQHSQSGKIYKPAQVTLWLSPAYVDYVPKLNENILAT